LEAINLRPSGRIFGGHMKRVYKPEKNVFDASIERLDFIFANFERIYLSFSGGKDSGVMLNLILDYMKKNGIKRKIGIQIMDNEANYEMSMEFMQRIIEANREYLDVYWCCLPITLPARS
jgi:predicted phosphoadenosine phosphosulfate sulfurtransferase